MDQLTITGLSGGKTSGYIGANYPGILLFSLVCVDDPKCASPDKKLMQYANDKIEKHCPGYGEVIGTAEDPIIFQTMYELEQFIGREVIWTRGLSFEQLIEKTGALPIKQKRWCTTFLKIEPAFRYWFNHFAPTIVKYNVGYRYDEKERIEKFTTKFDYPVFTRLYGQNYQKWERELVWREGQFPLVDNFITRPTINKFWIGKPVTFAPDSNCQQCMFKGIQQVKRNHFNNPNQIEWAADIEQKMEFNWHHDFSIKQAINIGLDQEFQFGDTDAGCDAGECYN